MIDSGRLNIVDETGKIVGEETRENIHKKGLLHREVHVWFYTSDGKIIFQHRAKNKDTFPDLLDATAGGHVDLGMGWLDSAIKETKEETGIAIDPANLKYIATVRNKAFDPTTNKVNNVIRKIYAYLYDDKIINLKIDLDEVQDLEYWDIDILLNKNADRSQIIPTLLDADSLRVYRKIKDLTK